MSVKSESNFHNYIIGFVPMLIGSIVFVVSMSNNTERVSEAVEELSEVVKENTSRGFENEKDIAILDSRVGYLEEKE